MNPLLDPWRRSIVLAGGLVVAGSIAIAIAWAGASRTLSIPSQVAYAVSGGMGGLALAGAGLALLQVQRRRYAAAEERRERAVIAAELEDLAEAIAISVAAGPTRARRAARAR